MHVLTGQATPTVLLMKRFRVQRHAHAHVLDLSVTVLRKLAESAGADTGGVLWVLTDLVGGGGGGFGGYHQPLSSLYMLDSVCQTPL